tara:strand:- start:3351 stop:3620 length:270 start_codon:yes stop_codon:yes gene_type:complete
MNDKQEAPATERIFKYAYNQSDCGGGEGWGFFADSIKFAMQEMEHLLREAADHVDTYDNGMSGWKERASILLSCMEMEKLQVLEDLRYN